MTLSDLAAMGSFVSGLAVLVSLIFLYFQLRQLNLQMLQTEKNQRALMNQGVVTRTTDMIAGMTEPHLNTLGAKVIAGEEDFSAAELNQLRLMLRMRLTSLQDVYHQHRSGLVDKITYDNSIHAMQNLLAHPTYRALWQRGRTTYAPELADFVDDLVARIPVAEPTDTVQEFKSDLAAIKRAANVAAT